MSPEKAFYFYRGIGQPLGTTAGSLAEFVDVLQGIDPESVKFHVERGDFEQWFRSLGEQALANQINGLRGKNISAQELRDEIGLTVGLRVKESHQGQRHGGGGGGYQAASAAARSGSASSGRSTG